MGEGDFCGFSLKNADKWMQNQPSPIQISLFIDMVAATDRHARC